MQENYILEQSVTIVLLCGSHMHGVHDLARVGA